MAERKRFAMNHFDERSEDNADFMRWLMQRGREGKRARKGKRGGEAGGGSYIFGVLIPPEWKQWRPFHVSESRCPVPARVMEVPDMPSPSPEQQQAMHLIEAGISLFITGPGGTGKSDLISYIKQAKGKAIAITASTGIAARNIGGMTLHRFAGLGLLDKGRGIDKVRRLKVTDRRIACWRQTDVLVVDEISMISMSFVEQLDQVARHARSMHPCHSPSRLDHPFGGMQLIFLGDFAQLGDWQAADYALLHKFVPFTVELRTIFRQSDPRFRQLLNNVRIGKRNRGDILLLNSRRIQDTQAAPVAPVAAAPALSAYRKAVMDLNHAELEKVACGAAGAAGGTRDFVTELVDGTACETRGWDFPALLRSEGLEPIVRLCIGTRVLLTRNVDPDRGLVNGTLGVVVDFTESGLPSVRWDSGAESEFTSTVSNITVEIQAQGNTLRVSYMPLLCAWAITIHRAQGMTLAMARIYSRTIKAPALMYTALSRVKTLAGLEIEGEVKEENIIARPEAVRFYTRLAELVDAQENGLAVVPTSMILEE